MRSKFLILFSILTLLTGCVGTVKDKNSKLGNITNSGNANVISFNGLSKVNPISHDKIELFFFPYSGNQDNLIYEVYVNSSINPISFATTSLNFTSSGLYRAVISGLSTNTTYSFNMKVKIKDTNASSTLDPNNALTTKTFSNQTADYLGVSTVERMPGSLGQTQIKVSWIAAKSIGGLFSARSFDPVRYEIKYISEDNGPGKLNDSTFTGSDLKTIYTQSAPASGNRSTQLDQTTSYIITGLSPDKTYYVQVRAIHSSYDLYKSDSKYKYEANTKYLAVSTLGANDVSSIDDESFSISVPASDAEPTKLLAKWNFADGAITNYRLCYKPITEAERIAEIDLISQPVTGSPIDFAVNNLALYDITCSTIVSTLSSLEINSMTAFSNYQFSLFACLTTGCEDGNRLLFESDFVYFNPPLPPFSGISHIQNPTDPAALRTITIDFEPPVTSDGYATEMKVYCYNGDNTTAYDLSTSQASRSGLCKKIDINSSTPLPILPSSTYPGDFRSLVNVKLNLTDTVGETFNGANKYCFKVVPYNSNAPSTISDSVLANAPKTCIYPQIITPNILEFEGRTIACTVVGDKIKVTWPKPTGGLYQGYRVYWKDRSVPGFFSFSNAIDNSVLDGSVSSGSYAYHEVNNVDTLEYSISDLTPGTPYGIGVLTYLDDGAGKIYYSQYNVNVSDCSLPLPKAKFSSWIQVLSIGPKENGLDDENSFIAETVDSGLHTTPREIELEDSSGTYIPHTTNESTKSGTLEFDGIYGTMKGQTAFHQYSNQGIIKLSWEDITLNSYPADRDLMYEYLSLKGQLATAKNTRKYGYKVYRSSDNQVTWKELTAAATTGQTSANRGLIYPTSASYRTSPNENATSTYIASFTDYSVKYGGEELEDNLYKTGVDYARIYYYKIVPVFNGKEIRYEDSDNPNHHILKVILPPKNMALVNRLMANRTFCEEIGKSFSKLADEHYTCHYNGLGSTGLSFPYDANSAVYDVGGDLLVDRFELGVRFSRGDKEVSGSTSSANLKDFLGSNASGSQYKGCYGKQRPDSFLSDKTGSASYGTSHRNTTQVGPGDCISDDLFVILNDFAFNPLGNGGANRSYFYVGAGNVDLANGSDEDGPTGSDTLGKPGSDFWDITKSPNITEEDYHQAQSQMGAVYLRRNNGDSYTTIHSFVGFTSPAGDYYNFDPDAPLSSNGYINFPYLDATSKMIPRWLDVSALFGQIQKNSGIATPVILYNKTFDELKTNPLLYGSGMSFPTASYNETSLKKRKIIRHITSNAAKLSPIRGFEQTVFNMTCQEYEVKVGFKDDTGTEDFHSTHNGSLKKRLFQRKEFIAASRWPRDLNESNIIEKEKGVPASVANPTPLDSTDGCNSNGRFTWTAYTNSLTKLDAMNLKNQGYYNILYPHPFDSSPLVMTGSSVLDNTNNEHFSTEKCQSMYGIQDLVGNMSEQSTEKIYCDASQASIYSEDFFEYVASKNPGTGVLTLSPPTKNYQSNHFVTQGNIIDQDGSLNSSARDFYGSIQASQGGCSISTKGPDVATRPGRSSSNTISSTLNINGSLDTSLIDTYVKNNNPLDPDSFQSARNGDGFFLSFGPDGILPNLVTGAKNFYEDLSLVNNYNDFKSQLKTTYQYFNTALGLPVACESGSCDNTTDNTLVTFRATAAGSSIENFVIGNSAFSLPGLSDISGGSNGIIFTYDPLGVFTNSFFLNPLTKQGTDKMVEIPGSGTFYNGQRIKLDAIQTTAKVNPAFAFKNGGSATSLSAGRFTLDYLRVNEDTGIYRGTLPNELLRYKTGGRCVVLIKDQDD